MPAHAQAAPRARVAVLRNRPGRAAFVALTALASAVAAAAAPGAPAAQAAAAHYEGVSAGGTVAVFSTTDTLVPGDTDTQPDVYVRELDEGLGYVTREASLGPTGGNDSYVAQYQAVDAAGDRVFFSTKERLTAADKDTAEDVYVRDLAENKTTLVSAGDPSCAPSGCGTANVDAGAAPGGIVDEGNRVFFVSSEQLSPQDKDVGPDLYVRDLEAGTTALVSAAAPSCSGSCGSGSSPAVFQGASADGSKAIFTTTESLASADEDTKADLYERDLSAGGGSGETKLVSTPGSGPGACPSGSCEPSTSAISANGGHVFFETGERIAGEDSDESQDVYEWSAGVVKLVSRPDATCAGSECGDGNEAHAARFAASSASGEAVFFLTEEALEGADEDSTSTQDVYVRRGSSTELVSAGDPSCEASDCGNGADPAKLEWVSPNGATAVLSTAEPLSAEDEDSQADVYARALPGGPTTLVSKPGPTCIDPECGNGPHDASFSGASSGGAHLFFTTDEALAPPVEGDASGLGDRDEYTDVYDRNGGTTTLVSAGQLGGEGPYSGNGEYDAQLRGVSGDAAHAFLTTSERLTGEDHDPEEDVYERSPSGTLLVSQGNDPELEAELAPPAPILEGTQPESPAASTEPEVFGSEPPPVVEASIKLYTTPDCSGEQVATGTTEELEEPGIAVKVAAGSTTAIRATAEAEGFISSCSAAVVYEQRDSEPRVEEEGGGGGASLGPRVEAPSPKPAGGLISLLQTPKTRITFGPAFKTRLRRPVFRFADSTGQAGTRFVCKLDRGGWKACASPIKLRKLSRGKHMFEVKGINAVGAAEAQPSKRSFKLVGGR